MKKQMSGFTLVELLITIAIMGIMAAIAFSGMSSFVANTRTLNRTEQIANLFRFARSEAVRLNAPVVICGVKIRSDGRPSGKCDQAEINSGLLAYADKNRNGQYEANIDTELRTISINGNINPDKVKGIKSLSELSSQTVREAIIESDKKIKVVIVPAAYAITPATGGIASTAVSPEFIFMPNGAFGGKPQKDNMSDLQLGSRYVRFEVADIDKVMPRILMISPTGVITICEKYDNNQKNLSDSIKSTICKPSSSTK